ncbi:ATP-binding cassette domain-containing protein [Polaromonas sp. P1(28)-13]|nr:ATP-binding cassette domain-containing protein [Polaromonas sp. P1(28)-13]
MIAMAIALNPDILIADEPTTALDVTVQARILLLLKELQRERGMGLLLITHDLGIVAGVADRVAIMNGGRIVESGLVNDVFNSPTHPYTRKLLGSMPGRQGFSVPRIAPQDEPLLLVVEGLSKVYSAPLRLFSRVSEQPVRALDSVSFTLKRGETLGIVGESGSGKSTLARTLIGLEKATGGAVSYCGQSLIDAQPTKLEKTKRHIQMVFQDPSASLNPRMNVGEIISEPWAIHPDVLERKLWKLRVGELLEQVGLKKSIPNAILISSRVGNASGLRLHAPWH